MQHICYMFFLKMRVPPRATLTDTRVPSTTLFRSLRIDPPARTRHPRDLLDHGGTLVVLQLDLDFSQAETDLFSAVIPDVAFALQDVEDVRAQLRRRRAHLRLPAPPSIADTQDRKRVV